MPATTATSATFANSSALTPPPDGDGCFAMNSGNAPGGLVSPCPDCGTDVVHPYMKQLEEAQARIAELEQNVKILTLRATSAMEKATEYETSLKRMDSVSSAGRPTLDQGPLAWLGAISNIATTATLPAPTSAPAAPPAAAADETAQAAPAAPASTTPAEPTSPERPGSRLARLLPTRMPSLRSVTSSPSLAAVARRPSQSKPTPSPSKAAAEAARPNTATGAPQTPPLPAPESGLKPAQFPMLSHTPPTPVVDSSILLTQLNQEQQLRRAAEAEASKTKSEIEELTGQLFEQANEMVAAERKARARLEARVEVLERRDGEKARRLGLLESRVQRVERVRGLLAESGIDLARTMSADRGSLHSRGIGVNA